MMEIILLFFSSGWGALALLGLLIVVAVVLQHVLIFVGDRYFARHRWWPKGYSLKTRFSPVIGILLFLILARVFHPAFLLPKSIGPGVAKTAEVLMIICTTWFLILIIGLFKHIAYTFFDSSHSDNLRERKLRTQIQFIEKLGIITLVILAACTLLLVFPVARKFGVGLLTSAGLAGVVVGFSAQKSLASFIAGLQIAFTQPLRLDDVVIVENEWGWIEEITLTYVVVRIWDLRRLVVPITYFVEKPFQNWTRTAADILGTVFIYVDYTFPVEEMRKYLSTILKENPLWDGKVDVLQVTKTTERTMEIRALMSCKDSPTAWNLRCLVREKLVAFVQDNYPQCLPQNRYISDGFPGEKRPKELPEA